MDTHIESRRIWFWQTGRYLDRGWNINRTTFRGTSPLCWPEALTDLARPWAVRSEPDRARPWATAPDFKTFFERVLGVTQGSLTPHQLYRALGMHAALSHVFGPPKGMTIDQLAEGYAAQIEAFAERVASGDVIGRDTPEAPAADREIAEDNARLDEAISRGLDRQIRGGR